MCLLIGWLHDLCLLWSLALSGLWAVSWYVCFRPVCGLCGLVGGFVVLAVAWPYIYRGGAVRFFLFSLSWSGPWVLVFFGWALPFWK